MLVEKNYYLERVGFSPLSLLKNPMILIAGFSMVIVFGMPYIMDNSTYIALDHFILSKHSLQFAIRLIHVLYIYSNTNSYIVDPELKAEFEERQKSGGGGLGGGANGANPLQNFDAAAWLAGSGGKKSEVVAAKSGKEAIR